MLDNNHTEFQFKNDWDCTGIVCFAYKDYILWGFATHYDKLC